MYSSQTKYKVNGLRVKSPNKANTDHHNGDNYSLNYLINFKTASVFIIHTLSVNLTLGILLSNYDSKFRNIALQLTKNIFFYLKLKFKVVFSRRGLQSQKNVIVTQPS